MRIVNGSARVTMIHSLIGGIAFMSSRASPLWACHKAFVEHVRLAAALGAACFHQQIVIGSKALPLASMLRCADRLTMRMLVHTGVVSFG